MERTEGQLGSRLTNSLGCDDAYGLALLHHAAGSEVASVTLHADALLALAGEHRTNLDALDGAVLDGLCHGLGNLVAGSYDELTG